MTEEPRAASIRGCALAVLTALVSRGSSPRPLRSPESLAVATGHSVAEVAVALAELQAMNCLTHPAGDSREITPREATPREVTPWEVTPWEVTPWEVTLHGFETFYSTLAEIRDALAPEQPSASLPFTLRTTWRECVCFNYLVDAALLRPLVPAVFELATEGGQGIVSVAVASLGGMRPAGLPEIAGKNFNHVTFRVVVRFVNHAGRTRSGYVFIESVTNSQLFTRIGNSVTEYRFHGFRTGDISFLRRGTELVLAVEESALDLKLVCTLDLSRGSDAPPADSVFSSREHLDRVVIDHDDAFGHTADRATGVHVLSIERDPWKYQFLRPVDLYFSYFQEGTPFAPSNARLDSVLYCQNVTYRWKPLRFEAL